MALRKPVVVNAGQLQQLQSGDTLDATVQALASGEVVLDFGTGADVVSATVARASVNVATTQVTAYLFPKATVEHSVDEHLVDPPLVFAHSVVTGVGFTVTATSPRPGRSAMRGADYLTGRYTVRWLSTE